MVRIGSSGSKQTRGLSEQFDHGVVFNLCNRHLLSLGRSRCRRSFVTTLEIYGVWALWVLDLLREPPSCRQVNEISCDRDLRWRFGKFGAKFISDLHREVPDWICQSEWLWLEVRR